MTTIDRFLGDLASAAPVPGGGSVAALQTAMAAALLEMVANLTMGRKRYAAVEPEATEIRDRASVLRERALALAGEDAAAYGRVATAMGLPRETQDERQTRSAAVQSALMGAAEPPLETMQLAEEIIRLAERIAAIGNRSAISDVGSAAAAAWAGFEAARLNVEINLAAVRDEPWKDRIGARLARFGPQREPVDGILRLVDDVIREGA